MHLSPASSLAPWNHSVLCSPLEYLLFLELDPRPLGRYSCHLRHLWVCLHTGAAGLLEGSVSAEAALRKPSSRGAESRDPLTLSSILSTYPSDISESGYTLSQACC